MLVGAGLSAQTARTFNGEIMDSNCAKTGAHHEGMAAKACTDACVKGGGSYVLYDAATKRTYMLDDQTKPAAFSGAKVAVTRHVRSRHQDDPRGRYQSSVLIHGEWKTRAGGGSLPAPFYFWPDFKAVRSSGTLRSPAACPELPPPARR